MSRACWFTALVVLVGCGTSKSEGEPREGDATPSPSAPVASPDGTEGCDQEKLRSLVEVLEAATPRRRGELVGRHLPDACELPGYLKYYFEVTSPAPDQRRIATTGPVAEQRAALRHMCPGADEVMKGVSRAAADERAALLFDGCELGRFGLVERARFVRGRGSPTPFLANQWMLDRGIDPEVARLVARALVTHDAQAMSPLMLPSQLEPPAVDHDLAEIPSGIAIYVARDGIVVDDQRVVGLDGGSLDPADVHSHVVRPLYEVLAEEADKSTMMAESHGEDWEAIAVVVADDYTPFSTMVDVYHTASRARFRRWSLVAVTPIGGYGAVPMDEPSPADGPPALFVWVDAGGFETAAGFGGERERSGVRAARGHDAWDYEALGRRAAEHRSRFPGAQRAVVMPEPDTPHGVVVRSLATLRGPDCGVGGDCVLPLVFLSAES